MSKVSIKEFQQLTGLSDSAVLWLLKHDSLRCSLDGESRLLVDLDAVSAEELRTAMLARQHEVLDANADLITEQLGNIVRERFEAIVDDALNRLGERKGDS